MISASERLEVVLVFDDSHARHAAVVLHSAASSLAAGYSLRAHLIVSGLGTRSEEGLDRVAAEHENLEMVFYRSQSARYENWLHGGHISAAAYLRLELGDHVSHEVSKLVYLDTDVLCRHSLHELIFLDLHDRTIGAVRDTTTPVVSAERGIVNHEAMGIPPDAPYFNSGVMLIDLARWREADPAAVGAVYVEEHGDVQQALDQELLNVCFSGDWFEIPLRWNVSPRLLNLDRWDAARRSFFEAGAEAATKDPGIIHFLGPRKPWRFRSDVPWTGEYLALARSCPFYKSRLDFVLWRVSAGVSEGRVRLRMFLRGVGSGVKWPGALVKAKLQPGQND